MSRRDPTITGRAWRLLSVVVFALGAAGALRLSWYHLATVIDRYQIIPSLLTTATQSLEFTCRDEECVTCLRGVRDTPNAIVFTGGSSFRYAIDFAAVAKAMPEPLVNCVRNDSRADAYRLFFSTAHYNQPDQVLLHGYNSWAVNSRGTWTDDQLGSLFARPNPRANRKIERWLPGVAVAALDRFEPTRTRLSLALLYAHIFLTREMTESPGQWRVILGVKSRSYAENDLKFLPLSRAVHQRRRLALMQRWFRLSAYANSFIIDAQRLRPAEEITARHEAFINSVLPTTQLVFFPAPELKAAMPDHVKTVMAQAKAVLLETLSRHPPVRHLEIDYAACGMADTDFWHEGAMYFDIPHVNAEARPKLTKCLIDALAGAGIADPGPPR